VSESVHSGNRVTLLHDGEQCLPAMLEAIEAAQSEILLEMYWFGSDRVGRRFADALSERARAGVRVCVSYDSVGSFETDPAMFQEMRAAGCGVHEYNPIRAFFRRFSFARLNLRNHRKLLVVDGRIALTGGLNLGDPWAAIADGGIFRDDMIRVEGPAAFRMRRIVLSAYRGAHRKAALASPPTAPEPVGSTAVAILTNGRFWDRALIERTYLERIRSARKRILITNSYFLPRRQVRQALAQAVGRGVHVQVLLPVESVVPAVGYATRRLYDWLLRHGIELYEWGQSILHSKTAAIDGHWCTVGSYNLDYRSFTYNL
jgi:cardiolipin synthase